eukprot:54631-Eustigmatos_ZCMA.PRE.1
MCQYCECVLPSFDSWCPTRTRTGTTARHGSSGSHTTITPSPPSLTIPPTQPHSLSGQLSSMSTSNV